MSTYAFDDVRPSAEAITKWRAAESYPASGRELLLIGTVMAAAADALIGHYLELLSAYELLHEQWAAQTDRLDGANAELEHVKDYLADPKPTIALLVEWEHYRSHAPYSFAGCPKEVCRAANERAS